MPGAQGLIDDAATLLVGWLKTDLEKHESAVPPRWTTEVHHVFSITSPRFGGLRPLPKTVLETKKTLLPDEKYPGLRYTRRESLRKKMTCFRRFLVKVRPASLRKQNCQKLLTLA